VELLKLDFLYAPYFDPKYSDSQIPDSFLKNIFDFIKVKYPKTYLMASGCPFEVAKYKVDSIRISQDIALPPLYKIPILKSLIHNQRAKLLADKWNIYSNFNIFFNLDPDVLIDQKIAEYSDRSYSEILKIFEKSKVKFFS
jgi:hypothetical protein